MICSKGAVRVLGGLAVLSIAVSAAAQPRGYTPRAAGYDLNFNGTAGEAGDLNLCDGQRDDSSTTGEDIDGNGVNDRQVYVDLSSGSDTVSCGLPGAPCRTITYALNGSNASVPGGPIRTPGAGQIQAVCFKGVGREMITLTQPGASGTYTLPRMGAQVRSFNLPRYPFILSGWDANNNDQYPPFDPADTSVLHGSWGGGPSLPYAIKNSNHLSNLEIAHFIATSYGQNGDFDEGFMKVVSGGGRAAQISVHDVQLSDILKGESHSSGRDIFDLFTGVSLTYLSVVNLNVINAGGGYFARGSGGPGVLQGPFRFQHISLTAFAAVDEYWAGFKFWDYLDGIEILDNDFDARPRSWLPHASGGSSTYGIGVTHCASDWTIAGNVFTDFKIGVVITPYGGVPGYCESRLTDNIVIDRNVFRNTYEPWNYGDNGILIMAGLNDVATTKTITITNNFLQSTTGWESCIWSNAGNPTGPQAGIVTIAGNTCDGRVNRHSAIVIGNPEGAQPAFPHLSYVIKDNVVTGTGAGPNIGTEFAVTGLVSDGNVFDPLSGFVWNNGPLTLAGWRTATNGDQNSKQCVPAFVDESGGNLRLAASDTCAKAAGVSLAGITTWDIDGTPRSGTKPSAGAHEGAGLSLPTAPYNVRIVR